jgi:microcompartment protein CcmK/EutM
MFAEAQASEPPPTTSVPVLPLGAAGSAGVAAAPAFEPVTPEPGMHMAVVQGAKVRADVSTTSQEMGALEDGQVIEVLEVRPTMEDSNQYRVRFDDGHGLAGWISSATKSTGRPVLRQLAEPLGVRRGAICQVKFEKAMVREGFPMESPEAGFLEQGDFIEVVDARVNEQNQVRVAFELEDAGHPHWVSMVATSGEVLLEALPEDWEGLAQDMDGDGVVDAEEQAQWAQYGAADIDGDGRVTQEEMRQFARQSASQHQHAHGAVQVHGDGDDVYD